MFVGDGGFSNEIEEHWLILDNNTYRGLNKLIGIGAGSPDREGGGLAPDTGVGRQAKGLALDELGLVKHRRGLQK